MNPRQCDAAYVTHLRSEHRRLHELLHSIECNWPATGEKVATAQLIEVLKKLRQKLFSHFREEDEGGCMEEAVSRLPSLGHEADRITQEHSPLLAELDSIISELQVFTRDSQQPVSDPRQDFAQFVRKLHAHETAENKVLERVFGIEVD